MLAIRTLIPALFEIRSAVRQCVTILGCGVYLAMQSYVKTPMQGMIAAVPRCHIAPAWTPYQYLCAPRLDFIPRRRMNGGVMATSASEASPDSVREVKDVVVQYVVLRRDLIDTWPLGSIVTQGCHASVSAIWEHKDDPLTLGYCGPENLDSMHKVTLEVKGETQILNLAEKLKDGGIAHKLWIEQPENIPTCLATKPYNKSEVSNYFKKLKLCK